MSDHTENRLSFFSRTAQLHRAMPRSWPATVKHLCSVLLTFSDADGGGIRPSVATLVEHTGEAERTVQRGRRFLRDGGFLLPDGNSSPRPGFFIPVERLDFHAITMARKAEDEASGQTQPEPKGMPNDVSGGVAEASQGDAGCSRGVTQEVKTGVSTGTQPKVLSKQEYPNIEYSRARETEPMGFEEWWDAYPRHDRKKDAIRAFKFALKFQTAEQLISAVRETRFDPDPQFQPLAVNWLWGKRWEDERPGNGIDPVLAAAGLSRSDFDHGTPR